MSPEQESTTVPYKVSMSQGSPFGRINDTNVNQCQRRQVEEFVGALELGAGTCYLKVICS